MAAISRDSRTVVAGTSVALATVLGALSCGDQQEEPLVASDTGGTGHGSAGEAGAPNTSGGAGGGGGSQEPATGGTGGDSSSEATATGSGDNGGVGGTTGDSTESTVTTAAGGSISTSCDTTAPEACDTPGARCENNVLIGCALDADGCLVEAERDCGEDLCDHLRELPTCSARGGQSADSCNDKQFLTLPASIAGEVFNSDFSDRQAFSDTSCASATVGSPEAVFAVDVPAGETLSVSEVSHLTSENLSVDAVFGIMGGCSDTTACQASGGLDDRGGISYTPENDETVAVWVSGNSALDGSYDIRVEIPETLGTLDENADLPTVMGGALLDAEWDTYVLHVNAAGVLSGQIEGNTNALFYNEQGSPVLTSNALSHFAGAIEPGSYRVVIDSLGDIGDYELTFSNRAAIALGQFNVGSSVDQEFPSILEGDRRFYAFELSDSAIATFTLTTTSGDADIWLFSEAGAFWDIAQTFGGTEILVTDVLPAGSYLLDVLAFEGSGDIDSHTLSLAFAAP